jgi:hypothetical protein
MSDAPDFITDPYDYSGQDLTQHVGQYVRRDPAVLAELPEVKALIAAAVEGAAAEADSEGWPGTMSEQHYAALTERDEASMDCGTRIAAAIRASTPADAKAALDRMLQEREQRGRNGALREAADEWLNVRAEGRLVMGALIAYSDRIRAMIQEATP